MKLIVDFVEEKADIWPLKQKKFTHYLHSDCSIKSLYDEFSKKEVLDITYNCFRCIFKKYCSHVEILKKGTEFCPVCYHFQNRNSAEIEDGHELTNFERYEQHLQEARDAKLNYAQCQKLRKNNALVVSFDFKSSILLPCPLRKLASTNYNKKLKIDFFGIVPENRKMKPEYFLFDSLSEAKKFDMIATSLILFCDRNLKCYDMLYIFCDNTVSQNKNRYIIALLGILRLKYNLSEIRLNFLVVGHTHMKADQCFGKVQKCLGMIDLFVPQHIAEIINRSHEVGNCYYVENVMNFSKFFINSEETKGITKVQTIVINYAGVYTSDVTLGQKKCNEKTKRKYWNINLPPLKEFNNFINSGDNFVKMKALSKKEIQEYVVSIPCFEGISNSDLNFYSLKLLQCCPLPNEVDFLAEMQKRLNQF